MKTFLATILTYFTVSALCIKASACTGSIFRNMVPQGIQTICSVTQDSAGLMWIGAENGLYSYNGYRFTQHFKYNDETNTRIHAMLAAGERLYLGTDNGLLVYSLKTGLYVKTESGSTGEVRALCVMNGKIILGAARGIFIYDPDKNAVAIITKSPNNIYSLLTLNGTLLAGSINGLYEIKNRRSGMIGITPGKQPLVNAMMADGNGGIWIGTEGELLHKTGKRLTSVKELNGNSIKALAKRRGTLYAGTDNGLYAVNADGTITHLIHDSRVETSIASNIVWALSADKYGNLWVGTDNGLALSQGRDSEQIISLGDITGTGEGNCIYDILREADGTTWLGGSNGLIKFSANTDGGWSRENNTWFRQNNKDNSMTHNRVRRIRQDKQGDILVCTDHGVNLYERRTGKMRNFIVTDKSGRYSSAWAYDIIQDDKGRYWISAYMGGVFMIEKRRLMTSDGHAVADRHFAQELQGLHVGRMALDRKGGLWLQLYGNGLDRIDTHTLNVKHVMSGKEMNVNFILTDKGGNVWAAGPQAVNMFTADGKQTRTFKLNATDSRRIAAMTAVNRDIWIVSGRECMVFNADGKSRRFVVPGYYTPLSLWFDEKTNTVIAGGNDAITIIPAKDTANPYNEKLTLTDIRVNGKQYSPDNTAATHLTELRLDYDENNITVSLSDLPYTGNRRGVYAYILEGAGNSWQHIGNDDMDITFNALPHGDYTLKVCRTDGTGTPASEVYRLKISILPPWWLTSWAKLIYTIMIAAIIAGVTKHYNIRKRLTEERKARKLIMEQSQARAEFYSALSGNLKSTLARIMAKTGMLLADENDTKKAIGLEQIRKDSSTISRLVYNTFNMSDTDIKTAWTGRDNEPADFVDFCRRTVSDAAKNNGRDKTNAIFHTDTPEIYMNINLAEMYPPLLSFISNAMTLAEDGGKTTINLTAAADTVTAAMKVDIPGLVIPKEQLPFVFYRYSHGGKHDPETENINELAVLRELAYAYGGDFNVISDRGNGTTFTMTLPFTPTGEQNTDSDNNFGRNHNRQDKTTDESTNLNSVKPQVDMADSKLLTTITHVIEKHITDSDFSVARLATDVSMGEKSLYRKVKQLTGKTPVELIRHIRMQRAAMLLRKGKFTVAEVMYMVGFQNSSYFSKCFARTYGITPAEYAKKTFTTN